MVVLKTLQKEFLAVMEAYESNEDFWWYSCKNKPLVEIDLVYIIMEKKLHGKCYYGGWQPAKDNLPARIILSGPFEKCPFERRLKGFRNFRYALKLW